MQIPTERKISNNLETANLWFLGLFVFFSITPSFAEDPTAVVDLLDYSTIHSLGFELRIDGDENHNAICEVIYRLVGAGEWKTALDLYRIDYAPPMPVNGLAAHFNGFAGSILFLTPGRTYEVSIELSDPDGGNYTTTNHFTTRPEPVKPTGGRMFHVIPGDGGGDGSFESPFEGIEVAQEQAQPGDIFLLHGGTYAGFDSERAVQLNVPGVAENYIVWQAAGDGEVILKDSLRIAADYLWVEGLHMHGHPDPTRRAEEWGLGTYNAPTGVVIRGNHFTDFFSSIILDHGGDHWVITDNTIVGDRDVIGTPEGPGSWIGEGIELLYTSGHTIAYNSISRVGDGISYPQRNTDIFRNEIFDVTDDGIEPDYGYANIRVWENRISNPRHSAFSFQPMNGGPWYFIRNQVAASLYSPLKLRETSRVLLAHNIFVGWDYALGSASGGGGGILTFQSNNNIWITANDHYAWQHNQSGLTLDWRTNLDYDGFDWGASTYAMLWDTTPYVTLEDFSIATGLQTNAITIDRTTCFETFDIPQPPPASMPFQYMSLSPSCNAIDAGIILPNINEGYTGSAPDLGPYERGVPLPLYGPRMYSMDPIF